MSLLDSLLGRASLKRRIEDLEDDLAAVREERDSLEERLSAEQERRADAVTARQDAEERINRLEDRIAQLEGDLDRERTEEGPSFRGVERLGPDAVEGVLDRLDSVDAGPEGALTATVTDDVPAAASDAFGERAGLLTRAAPCVAVTDDHGLVSAALSPPLAPPSRVTWSDGFRLDRSTFLPAGRHRLAVVRADVFALGVYEGRERVAFEGFESDVKGDHSKGGYSQARFERLRDEQIEAHLDRCRSAIEGVGEGDTPLYLAGDRAAVEALSDQDPAATAAVDATGAPEAALETAVREFWTTRLYLV